MKCSFGSSNFLEEISSLSYSIIFLLFLCIVHLKRLSCLSLLFSETLHSGGYIFPFLLCSSLLFLSGFPDSSPLVRKICWRRDRLPTPVFLGFPCDSAGKESACNVGNLGSIPDLGRSPGEKGKATHSNILAWRILWTTVHGVAKSWTLLSDFHFQS